MADAVWPGSLPTAPLTRGLDESPPDLTVRSGMNVGPDKVRGRATVGVTVFTTPFIMSGTQIAILDTFFRDTLFYGALTFSFQHPRTGVVSDFRFVGPPKYEYLAPRQGGTERYNVACKFELIPSADAVLAGGGGGGPPAGGGAAFDPPWQHGGGGGVVWELPEYQGETSQIYEDPPVSPEVLLWLIGAGDQAGASGGDGGGDGGAGPPLQEDDTERSQHSPPGGADGGGIIAV